MYEELGTVEDQVIYKARRKRTIKFLAISRTDRHLKPLITNHVRFVSGLRSSSVLKFYQWYETGNHLWLVMELFTGGSLEQVLREEINLTENVIRKYGSDIVLGLQYIHSRGVLYNDMKPSRVILSHYLMFGSSYWMEMET